MGSSASDRRSRHRQHSAHSHPDLSGALVGATLAWTLLWASPAAAQSEETSLPGDEPQADPTAATAEMAPEEALGPHTLFLGSVQLLSMPAASLCPAIDRGELKCTPGEASLGFGLAALGRWRNFAFGGGFTWAFGLRPTTVAGATDPELLRQQSRNYLVIEGLFRYYLPPLGNWDWWVGAGAGGLVVSDTFSTEADRNPYTDTSYVGPRAVTLRSEGAAFSIGIGGHWRFTEQFLIGTHLRYANWLLPTERERTPLGDSASLAGRIDVIDAGVVVGALLPL